MASDFIRALVISAATLASRGEAQLEPIRPVQVIENPDSGYATSNFGATCDLGTTTLIVGDPSASLAGLHAAGQAFIYERDEAEEFQFSQALCSDQARRCEAFGTDVAMLDELIVVGAPSQHGWTGSDGFPTPGSLHLFHRGRRGWSRGAIIRSPDKVRAARFGESLDAAGADLIVGAPNHIGYEPGHPRVYFYAARLGELHELARFEGEANSYLGEYVCMGDGVAGAAQRVWREKDTWVRGIVLYRSRGGTWLEDSRIEDPQVTPLTIMQPEFSVSSDRVLARFDRRVEGGPTQRLTGEFIRSSGHWRFAGFIPEDSDVGVPMSSPTFFRSPVAAVRDATAAVRFTMFENPHRRVTAIGIWERRDGDWSRVQDVHAPANAADQSRFGSQLAVEGDDAVVGGYDVLGGTIKRFQFIREDGVWRFVSRTPDPAAPEVADRCLARRFLPHGSTVRSVSQDRDQMVVLSQGREIPARVDLISRQGKEWSPEMHFPFQKVGDVETSPTFRADVSRDTVVLAARADRTGFRAVRMIDLYRRGAFGWQLELSLSAESSPTWVPLEGGFAIQGDTLAIGVPFRIPFAGGGGGVVIHRRVGTNWRPTEIVNLPLGDGGGSFGTSVVLDGDALIVTGESRCFLFRDAGGGFALVGVLSPAGLGDRWLEGASFAFAGPQFLIGVPNADAPETRSGVVLAYNIPWRGCIGDWTLFD